MSDSKPESYTVLARRFRPQTFSDVIGQEHVGQALRNAIKSNRVAHAYLFTGARGVGKTSTARIFAKALNCPHTTDGVPCNQCDVCQGIAAGSDVDVLEIDGASNRGIDDIRQLRANVNVRSMRSAFKVYIIDEVHMLTKEAFNALLKTLEEPPPNVKFVFCTTEPNKVPDTILSRCQRFDFGTISTASIAARLTDIARQEGIQVDADAIELVARRAAGSMRDSQSLFDQLLAFGEEHITVADVHKLLGTAPDERMVELINALIERDRATVLRSLDEALSRGVQLGPFGDQLLEYLRDLLVLLAGAEDVALTSVGPSFRETLKEQGSRWGLQTVAAAMQIVAETKARMQRVNYGRALMELALVRLTLLADLDDLGTLARNLTRGGGPVSRGPARPAAPGPDERPPAKSGLERPSDSLRQKWGRGGAHGSTVPPTPPSAAASLPSTNSPELSQPTSGDVNGSGAHASDPPGVETRRAEPPPRVEDAPSAVPARETEVVPRRSTSFPDRDAASSSGDSSTEPVAAPSDRIPLSEETRAEFLARLCERVEGTVQNHLRNSTDLAIFGPSAAEIVFPKSYLFSMNYCQRPAVLKELERLATELSGTTISLRLKVDERSPAPTIPRASRPETAVPPSRLRPAVVEKDPFVQAAVSIFGGTVVDVRPVPVDIRDSSETDHPEPDTADEEE